MIVVIESFRCYVNFAWTGYVALIISQHPSMLVVGGSLHCCCLVQFCSWMLVGKRGCARTGGDVQEREKYVMVVNGYCG